MCFKRPFISFLAVEEVFDVNVAFQVSDLLITICDQILGCGTGRIGVADQDRVERGVFKPVIQYNDRCQRAFELSGFFFIQLGCQKQDTACRIGQKLF